jgi:two-component system response regulator HydG
VGSTATGILGCSSAITELNGWLPKVARSLATVLITGETGTGKERVAQAIHGLSARADGPFVPVNCAALPDQLVESELFGHEKGAFTGAWQRASGRMADADGGTLFLDEIGELPLRAQAKLLRAIESREVRPLGGSRARHLDIRIVAATNQDLAGLVRAHGFRQDLFYRLDVARIELAPLRDRPEDVPLLMAAAIAELNDRNGAGVGAPDPELMDCLVRHDWPGNVRELRNLAEAIFIDPPRGPVGFRHLPPSWRRSFERYRRAGSAERDALVTALKSARWNKAEAARTLNWSRMTLYRKLQQYRISRPPD